MPSTTVNVFVSYSHADASLVAPVVRLLRVNESLVFQDTDGIPPGKRWRDEIAKALARANLVVVFWCCHAFRSNEVSNEWRAAIEQEKDVLPVLLDATPLPSELTDVQWIDFRATVGANHGAVDSLATQPAQVAKTGCAYAILVAILLSTPNGSLHVIIPLSDIVVIICALTSLLLSLLWLWRRQRFQRTTTVKSQFEAIQRRIAAELGAEILRRTGSAQDAGA